MSSQLRLSEEVLKLCVLNICVHIVGVCEREGCVVVVTVKQHYR